MIGGEDLQAPVEAAVVDLDEPDRFVFVRADVVTSPGGGSGCACAAPEEKEALAKQRQIITELRGMLVKLDVIKTLDDAAARLDAAADKQLVVKRMDEEGAFELREAVEQIAHALGVSRMTVYAYLRQ